jgi:hypothetical protein
MKVSSVVSIIPLTSFSIATMAVAKTPVKSTDTSASALQSSISTLVQNYRATTLTRTKLIDCFLLVLVVSGVLQFAYRILITSYPFNAFLGRSVCSLPQKRSSSCKADLGRAVTALAVPLDSSFFWPD